MTWSIYRSREFSASGRTKLLVKKFGRPFAYSGKAKIGKFFRFLRKPFDEM